jgi:hypothetical protein
MARRRVGFTTDRLWRILCAPIMLLSCYFPRGLVRIKSLPSQTDGPEPCGSPTRMGAWRPVGRPCRAVAVHGVAAHRRLNRKARPKPRSPANQSALTPVPLDQHPTTMAVFPVMRNPHGMRMRRTIPASGNPDVAIPVPAVIAVYPDKPVLRRWGTTLHDRCRWPYPNINLRICCPGKQAKSKQST